MPNAYTLFLSLTIVINCCHVFVKDTWQTTIHIAPWPMITCCLSIHVWSHWKGGSRDSFLGITMAVCMILAMSCSEKPKKERIGDSDIFSVSRFSPPRTTKIIPISKQVLFTIVYGRAFCAPIGKHLKQIWRAKNSKMPFYLSGHCAASQMQY